MESFIKEKAQVISNFCKIDLFRKHLKESFKISTDEQLKLHAIDLAKRNRVKLDWSKVKDKNTYMGFYRRNVREVILPTFLYTKL